jgi:hypothetical protein
LSEISDKSSLSTVPLGMGQIDDARAGLERGFGGETFLSGDRRDCRVMEYESESVVETQTFCVALERDLDSTEGELE